MVSLTRTISYPNCILHHNRYHMLFSIGLFAMEISQFGIHESNKNKFINIVVEGESSLSLPFDQIGTKWSLFECSKVGNGAIWCAVRTPDADPRATKLLHSTRSKRWARTKGTYPDINNRSGHKYAALKRIHLCGQNSGVNKLKSPSCCSAMVRFEH